MLREIVRCSAENDDASPMLWVELWAMTPIGIWFLVSIRPAPDRQAVTAVA
jgi:hypothetical protein